MLIINNLVASMMWHRLNVLDPPKDLLQRLQKTFVDFFWDGYHWLPPAVLYLPVNEGGQGLIDLAAKVKAMSLKTDQNLLYPVDLGHGCRLVWLCSERLVISVLIGTCF